MDDEEDLKSQAIGDILVSTQQMMCDMATRYEINSGYLLLRVDFSRNDVVVNHLASKEFMNY